MSANVTSEHVDISDYAIEEARKFCPEGMTLTEQKAQENDDTMVTVICITYAHEQYIAQALDSFLMQKVNFKFKVFVGEDCGPDGTADIVREYAERYPNIIVPFLREKNMGAQRNLIDMCQKAASPYIAFCEGDDYWIDEYKLQKQINAMKQRVDMRACFHNTEIIAPDDWYLNDYYIPNKEGKRLIPFSIPRHDKRKTVWKADEYILSGPAHTSSMLFRWNYDLSIPETYYVRESGDHSMMMMQLGDGKLLFLPDVMSAYRRSEVGITMFGGKEEHFFKTRCNWISVLEDLKSFFGTWYGDYCKASINDRIILETYNYFNTLIRRKDIDRLEEFFFKFPASGIIAMDAYLSFYRDQRMATGCWGREGYNLIVRNKYCRNLLKPLVRFFVKLKKLINFSKGKLKNLVSLVLYWRYTLTPKDKNIWVFSGFNKTSYMDNSKYLYEYVLENHPEIQAVWTTLSKDVFQRLSSEGKPVVMMRTAKCRKIVSRAAIAVTDHFRMSDYEAFSGLNDRLKMVQLWHGVGLKTIGDLKNTNVPGVKWSNDILPMEQDGLWTKIMKRLKYFRHAYYRELFERYFMLVCPGQERMEQIAKPWNIPAEACFVAGHPRNVVLHTMEVNKKPYEILYAPTYRWNKEKEQELVNQIAECAEQIQQTMQMKDAVLTIRLHPHTWRNYIEILDRIEQEYDRIRIDRSKDVYQTLGKYSVVISDYSSIAYDFILLDRPAVFFNYDFEEFIAQECKLNYDYDEYSPGIKTKSWKETLDAVSMYLEKPETDSAWRQKVRDEFYDMSVNDKNNSERIVQEIKRRLSL